MKNRIHIPIISTAKFTVSVDQINNNRALLPIVLYEKMENFAIDIVMKNQDLSIPNPSLTKLNILKNAYLNDVLKVKSSIKKFNANELLLSIEVYKELRKDKDIICNALFSFDLKKNAIDFAS
ncbi:MAG: hypothetical protein QM478_09765 [Flavobacteriaceae bacterium]